MICPNCKGKGHVLDGEIALIMGMTIFYLPLLFFERNDKRGTSRKICSHCDGKGVIEQKNDD
jgi:DnaJ-class molecular chaperone